MITIHYQSQPYIVTSNNPQPEPDYEFHLKTNSESIDGVLSAMEDFLRAVFRLSCDEHLEIVDNTRELEDE